MDQAWQARSKLFKLNNCAPALLWFEQRKFRIFPQIQLIWATSWWSNWSKRHYQVSYFRDSGLFTENEMLRQVIKILYFVKKTHTLIYIFIFLVNWCVGIKILEPVSPLKSKTLPMQIYCIYITQTKNFA